MSTPAATLGRRGLWRWAVALVATVMLVVSGSSLVVFAQSGAGESKGPQFVPAPAPVYIEARLDMPDGQADALAQLLTAFPGFTDAGAFGLKRDQLLDGLIGEATGGALAYTGELESFLTGEIGLALPSLDGMSGEDAPVLIGIAISDRAAAESFLELMNAGGTMTTTESGGATVMSNDEGAIAVHDEWVLFSQESELIGAGIDTLDGVTPSLADDETYVAAIARVPDARLASAYMNLEALAPLVELGGMMAAGETGMDLPTEDILSQLPESMVAYLAAETDRMTLEAFVTPGAMAMEVPTGESELSSLFPADTQLYIETRELGQNLETVLTEVFTSMDEETMQQIAPIESMLGVDLPKFLDFVEDAGIGASIDSDGLWLGIAAEVSDDATAGSRVERIMSIVRLLSAGQADGAIAIEEMTVGDATVTVITVPMDEAMAGSGLPIQVGDTISVAVSDGSLLIGTGDFVENALTQSSVDSLGASAGYTDALGDDTANAGVLYANISALLTELDPLISMMVPEWSEIQPYATGVDRFIAVGHVDDEVISSRMSVIVNQ